MNINMIEISFPLGEIIFACLYILFRLWNYLKNKEFNLKEELIHLLIYINLAVIIRFAYYPFFKSDGLIKPLYIDLKNFYSERINLIPIVNILRFATKKDMYINLIGNVALFIPTGILLPFLYKRLNNFFKVVGTGMLISLIIEITQIPIYDRACDIDDLILNSLGVIIGYLIYLLFKKLFKKN